MFSCYLLFQLLGLPASMHRTAMALLVGELVALGVWSYGSEGCDERPCAPVVEAGRTAAAVDIPLLALLLVVVAVIRGVRAQRRARTRTPSDQPTPSADVPAVSGSRSRGTRADA
jgi:hypothetical protein